MLKQRLGARGYTVSYAGRLQKMGNWGKWNKRNFALAQSKLAKQAGHVWELHYNKQVQTKHA